VRKRKHVQGHTRWTSINFCQNAIPICQMLIKKTLTQEVAQEKKTLQDEVAPVRKISLR